MNGAVDDLVATMAGLVQPLRWTRLEGGHSNLTYVVEDSGGLRCVVRRPPFGELQPRAHDMHREYTVMNALQTTDVPVPRTFGYCSDPEPWGAEFYVMEFIDARSLPDTASTLSWLPANGAQARCSHSLTDVLADLHRLDPDEIGLDSLSSRKDFAARQLKAWYRSWNTSAAASGIDDARAHEVHDLLAASTPADRPSRLIHGDYGLHNILVARDGRVAAVIDWEVCTLGDPSSDLAYLLNRWSVDGEVVTGREDLTLPPSFGTSADVVRRYAASVEIDPDALAYYITLNHWRSACIVQGVLARYANGQKSSDGVDLAGLRAGVDSRLAQAASSVRSQR